MLDFIISFILMAEPNQIGIFDKFDQGLLQIDQAIKTVANGDIGSSIGAGIMNIAKAIGGLLCTWGILWETLPMVMGKRVVDVMKILRIFIMFFFITVSPQICGTLNTITNAFTQEVQTVSTKQTANVWKKYNELANAKAHYTTKLFRFGGEAQAANDAMKDQANGGNNSEESAKDPSWWDSIVNGLTDAAGAVISIANTGVMDVVASCCMFLGQCVFSCMYYGLLISGSIFTAILGMFAPIAFAMSVFGPWENAWSQWLTKYISVGLWGFVTYMVVYYVDYIMIWGIQQDIDMYEGVTNSTTSVKDLLNLATSGLNSIVFCFCCFLIASKAVSFVPEVASWLIPGGVSSSAGRVAQSAAVETVSAGAKML